MDPEPARRIAHLRQHDYLDYIVIDGGEEPFSELVAWWRDGDRDPAKLPRNLIYLDDSGELVATAERPLTKTIEGIESPYLGGDLDEFLAAGMVPMLETNRGCPFRCTFCAWGDGIEGSGPPPRSGYGARRDRLYRRALAVAQLDRLRCEFRDPAARRRDRKGDPRGEGSPRCAAQVPHLACQERDRTKRRYREHTGGHGRPRHGGAEPREGGSVEHQAQQHQAGNVSRLPAALPQAGAQDLLRPDRAAARRDDADASWRAASTLRARCGHRDEPQHAPARGSGDEFDGDAREVRLPDAIPAHPRRCGRICDAGRRIAARLRIRGKPARDELNG